jgi:hypothetical protein
MFSRNALLISTAGALLLAPVVGAQSPCLLRRHRNDEADKAESHKSSVSFEVGD